ncbi:MAG: permease-like cell division protein FtsX [Paludibacteraceae bacterium]|nr:permease-like cell division protein FtsX [Paludibacteraceae bacterium]
MSKKKIRRKKYHIRNAGVTATFSMSLVLFLIGLLALSLFLTRDMTNYVKENLNLSIVLNEEITEQQTKAIENYLTKSDFAKSVEYISKEQALKEHIEYLGEDPQAFLGYNPLFAMFEVKLNAAYANNDSVPVIESKLKRFGKRIDEVSYQKDVIAEVNENIRKISIILIGIVAVLLLISFALINNTVRLRIYSNRFLINTMKLVGAKSWFIRKPYIKQSVINGIIAAAIALGLMAALVYYFKFNFGVDMQIIKPVTALTVAGIVIVTGIVLTAISSYFAVGRYLRMRTDDMYYV